MLDHRIKFRHLQAFVEVARQRSVGKAADLLHVSQPAITKTLRELEEILGVDLVEREGRGIRVSRSGEIFLRHAGASIAAIQQGVESVARAEAGPPLRIGALPTVAARIMPQAIGAFLKEGTGSPIKIVTGENLVLIEQLKLGLLDLVVGRLAAPEQMTGLRFAHLYAERIVFVVRTGHPLLASDTVDFSRLRDFTMLMPTRSSIIRPFAERFLLTHGIAEIPQEIETVSDAFGRAFLEQSDAIWMISEGVVARDIKAGTIAVLPIDTSETAGSVGLTTRADPEGSSAVALIAAILRTTVTTEGL